MGRDGPDLVTPIDTNLTLIDIDISLLPLRIKNMGCRSPHHRPWPATESAQASPRIRRPRRATEETGGIDEGSELAGVAGEISAAETVLEGCLCEGGGWLVLLSVSAFWI